MAAPSTTLTYKTTRGVAWMMAQTVSTKLVNTLGQIVLAWLLLKEDYGLIALAYTVTTFADLIYQAGIREVLVQRHKRYRLWSTPAFWMSLSFGMLGALAMVGAAPLAAAIYNEPVLIDLILVLALAAPFNALAAVPQAKLQIQLRYRAVAALETARGVGLMLLTILFAAIQFDDFRFGAFAFVIPKPMIAIMRLGAYWWMARPRIGGKLHFRRWRYLVRDSSVLLAASFFMVLATQGDRMVLGLMYDDVKVVGGYFFAYALSNQTIVLFTVSLQNVLFPALSKLQSEPERQRLAFVRAARLMALIGVPTCIMLAATAHPLVRAIFEPRWHDTSILLQLLAVGMAFRILGGVSVALLKAQGRFGTTLVLFIAYSIVFLIAVYVGASLGQELGVAAAVAVYSCGLGPISLYVAIAPVGGTARDVVRVFAAPVLVSIASIGPAWALSLLIPDDIAAVHWMRLLLTAIIGSTLYLLLIRRAAPVVWSELMSHLSALRGVRSPEPVVEPADREPL